MFDAPPPPRWELLLEGAATQTLLNDVRVPGDATLVDFRDLAGRGTRFSGRGTLLYRFDRDHGLRLVAAPFQQSGTGTLPQTTFFAGETFQPGVATRGDYKFNSYRASYWRRWNIGDPDRNDFRAGITLKVRDARVALAQGETAAEFTDVGLVPLVHLGGSRSLGRDWRLILDFDGLWAPQGRAFDIGVFAAHRVGSKAELILGIRTLDGGANNPRTYNQANVLYYTSGISLRF
jgi:hypothetical protein